MRVTALLISLAAWASVGVAEERAVASDFALKTIAKGFEEIVDIEATPSEPQKLFVVEREGAVRVLENGKSAKHDLLDLEAILAPRENHGLSSLAFPLDYDKSRAFYVSYTDKQGDTIIGRFPAKLAKTADEDDLMVVLKVVQPSPHTHSSSIAFGPEGYLYIALGDPPGKRGVSSLAQNPQSLFGKVLRIDLSDPQRYRNPPDNPYANGEGGAPEVWAMGFQQPKNISFDLLTKRLFLLDSGSSIQEIDLVERGRNYGWNLIEGKECVATKCESKALTPPLFSYKGRGVGGFVYSGDLHLPLKGTYLFADPSARTIFKLERQGGEWKNTPLIQAHAPVTALAQGGDGQIYVGIADGSLAILETK